MASRKSAGCVVSGASTITTSAHRAASATVSTVSPAAAAAARDRLDAGSPTRTSTPLSRRLSAWACPCDP